MRMCLKKMAYVQKGGKVQNFKLWTLNAAMCDQINLLMSILRHIFY